MFAGRGYTAVHVQVMMRTKPRTGEIELVPYMFTEGYANQFESLPAEEVVQGDLSEDQLEAAQLVHGFLETCGFQVESDGVQDEEDYKGLSYDYISWEIGWQLWSRNLPSTASITNAAWESAKARALGQETSL